MMGGLFQINPIWNFGPYNPAQISAGVAARLLHGLGRTARPGMFPAWEIVIGNYRIPAAFWADGGVPAAARSSSRSIYPTIERKMTGDNALHNLLQRPRDVPVRTSLGVMAI